MALWQPTEGQSPRFGVSGGDVWAAGQGSPTVANMPRTANRFERRQFVSWTKRGPWETHWQGLSGVQQTEWEVFAESNLLHRLTGQPGLTTGQDFFITYWSQATLFNGSQPAGPWPLPDPPEWNADNSPFEPWLDSESDMAVVLQAETTSARNFFFVAQPPLPGRAKLTRARCIPLGVFELPASAAGYRWTAPSAAAAALFGPNAFSANMQQWMLAWELSGWCPRPVLDPCFSPPVAADPCAPVYPASGEVDGSGTGPSINWGTVVPVPVELDAAANPAFYKGSATAEGWFTEAPEMTSTMSVFVTKTTVDGVGRWLMTASFSASPTGPVAMTGLGGLTADCNSPVGDSFFVEGGGWDGALRLM